MNPDSAAHAVTDVPGRLASWNIPSCEQRVEIEACILYALSVGVGVRPDDPGHLKFVYEKELEMLPSMVMAIAAPGFWFKQPSLGVDWKRLVNVAQSIEIVRLPKPPFSARSASSVVQIIDKGRDKGVICTWERRVFCAETLAPLAIVTSTVLLRGDGRERREVLNGDVRHVYRGAHRPLTDGTFNIQTAPNSGLLYRLNGTLNPLHADPEVARHAGFERAIMPGTASLGIACAAIVGRFCQFQPERLKAIGARMTSPLYPGERLECRYSFEEESRIDFQMIVPERQAVVLDDGHAILAGRNQR